ncbi:hypothetical protein CWT12_07075 [Actinomyces sp. 432]|uniref:hypothetical protein n=1 Tax=Actinomyces sp. 432 TaxID=2057798 RepID=UPI00137415E4|nr:hypothetical protein [Actinomyces sp. 432]QHO91134.1 hypothetical protein CWT12_07075 [Actinomyces sp. 432]
MRALKLVAWACSLRSPGLVFAPSVRSFALALMLVLIWAATRGEVIITGGLARSLTVAGLGALVAVANASALLRDLDSARRGALRYYGFRPADFLALYAVMSLPLTALEAVCGTLVLDFPGWSEPGRFGLLLAAWTVTTALGAVAADWLAHVGIAPGLPMTRLKLRIGARLRSRVSSLCVVYLCSASWLPTILVAAVGVVSVYALGRFGQSVFVGVFVAGAYLAATVIGVLAEVDDTPSARYARSRYAIADAELRRAKLALALPLLVAECLAASTLGMVAGARIDVVHLLVCLVYLPLLAMALADAATAYTRRHRMLPAAELGGALLALVPGLPLAVLPAAAHLLRRSKHA